MICIKSSASLSGSKLYEITSQQALLLPLSHNHLNRFIQGHSAMSRHYQQQHNARFNSRILDRRIQRRNMTDPLSTSSQISGLIGEKHSVLMNSILKRNSLNDKTPQHQPPGQLVPNLYGDSTSTILSTDSGLSSTSCDNNHISFSSESISKSPIKQLEEAVLQQGSRDHRQDCCLDDILEGQQDVQACKNSSLRPTNSVLSTASSTFSSSSSQEPNNMSYSSSFNSTSTNSSSCRLVAGSLRRRGDLKSAMSETENDEESRHQAEYLIENDTK